MVVSTNNVLNERMPDYVKLGKMYEPNAIGSTEDLFRFDETGCLPRRQINLRDVTGDHGLGTVSQSG